MLQRRCFRACCASVCLLLSSYPHTHVRFAEYCARGSLYDVLRVAAADPARAAELTWSRRLGFALDAALGLFYLHSRSPAIIHRDGAAAGVALVWAR